MASQVKKVQENKLIGGETVVIHRETGADSVLFDDGETFQKKFDDGKLTGPAGTPGDAGDTWVPSVDESGLLTWEKNSGTEPVSRNIKGADGKAGANGVTPTLNVAEGEHFGEAGTPAVTMSKADNAYTFTFNYMKGAPGAQGAKGDNGGTGPAGPNKVSTDTATDVVGLLKGFSGKVAAAVAGTDYAAAQHTHSDYVPTSRKVNGKALSGDITLTASDVQAASKPTEVTLTLTSTGWSNNAQTVSCSGVVADETKQEVSICPKAAQFKTYMDAGIYVSAVAADKLTFTCETKPSSDITVYVKIQNF